MPLAATSLEETVATHGAFEAAEVVGMVVAIASALESVHRHRLVHADVKPANILLEAGGRPLLADFGAAHPIGTPPTNFTPTYFVDDGTEGDVASLARCALQCRRTATAMTAVRCAPCCASSLGSGIGLRSWS